MNPENIVVLTRAAILIIAALAGVMCIYLGWRLFFEGTKSRTDLEITHANLKVLLRTSTPGLFFTLFGAGLLIFSINNRIEISVTEGGAASTKSNWMQSSEPNRGELRDRISYIQSPRLEPLSDWQYMATASPTGTAVPAPAQKPPDSTGCKYKSIEIKWFDTPDPRPESVVIVEAIDVAISTVASDLRSAPSGPNAAQQRKTLVVLQHVKRGFE